MKHSLRLAAFACTTAFSAVGLTAGPAGADSVATTVAGTGKLGIDNGPAARATFALPYATAIGETGEIYVADAGGQQIRRIENGVVSVFAGAGGTVRLDPQWPVAGGFLNGPAATAKFLRPDGIALLPDGTVLVADAGNHCIRAIRGGVVSTFSGLCGVKSKPADGGPGVARFGYVRGLAVDAIGTVFVADFDGGLREISPSGFVSTIALPPGGKPTLEGVAVWGSGANDVIFVSDRTGIVRVDERGYGVRFTSDAEGRRLGFPDALVALGPREVALTDGVYNTIRIFRDETPTGGLPGATTWQIGFNADGQYRGTGDLEGPPAVARFTSPRGISADHFGNLFISDTGNRRIREIHDFDARIPIENGDPSPADVPDATAIVGGSSLFFDTIWQRSIPGDLERAGGHPVVAYRFKDGSMDDLSASLGRALAARPARIVLLLTSSVAGVDAGAVSHALSQFAEAARAAGVPFAVVAAPVGSELSPDEGAAVMTDDPAVAAAAPGRYLATLAELRAPGVPLFDLAAELRRDALAPGHYELSSSDDVHFTTEGSSALALALDTAMRGSHL